MILQYNHVQMEELIIKHNIKFKKTINTLDYIFSKIQMPIELAHLIITYYGFSPIFTNDTIKKAVKLWKNNKKYTIHISFWDTSNITNMSHLFAGDHYFNDDINFWDVSNVRYMAYMFNDAKNFNQPLNKWNVKKVCNMEKMFRMALKFNQPLNSWNVSNVKI